MAHSTAPSRQTRAAGGAGSLLTPGAPAVTERGARIAAGRLRISVEEYRRHTDSGEAWCSTHQDWHPASAFGPNKGRAGGRSPKCRQRAAADVTRILLTPEGAAVATSADAAWSVSTSCAQNATASTPGHIYRPVEYLRPMQAYRLERMSTLLGVPVSGVVLEEAAS